MNGPYAGLRMAARAGKPDPENTETMEPEDEEESSDAGGKKEKETMNDKTSAAALDAAKAEGRKEGFAEANERFSAVIASEHYAGREQLAHKLLGNVNLGADDIIDVLQAAEKKAGVEASTNDTPDPEAAARGVMKAAIEETGNSDADADGGGSGAAKSNPQAVWDNIRPAA